MHNTSTPRLNTIADDLIDDGWYMIGATIAQVAKERDMLYNDVESTLQQMIASGEPLHYRNQLQAALNRARNIGNT